MTTYKELLAQKEALEVQLEEARQAEVGAAIEHIRELMDQYGLTVDDLARRRGRGRPRTRAPSESVPMYQDPKTGKTWSGRGRAPGWLGKNREKFRIEQG
ncbi:H-NS histone family protein [Cupriavidus respiraculi]|uniref:DNA-binding protein Bv3F n=1 Tax=Cupriavidus respiraculi TaxID=195930 RepID=A0ABM8XUR9_9BURK|nr:H-NS histone family protein [Cupriavidus respiraculi]MBY4949561.1 H-NS histone family protein [Cupriavidus respiraculi]CAG9184089.1 DNA-binding protein Bv3F [Cupriavidus respiraculi]